MRKKLGESLQAEWDTDPFANELWDALGRGEAEPDRGMQLVQELAKCGSPLAMLNLAEIYAYGMFAQDRDFPLALHWSQRAADAGSTEGKFLLARLLEGEGRIEDAHNLLLELVDDGFPIAMWVLGNWYYKGEHVTRDLTSAVRYFDAAGKLGHIPSKHWLNYILRQGKLGTLRRIEGFCKSLALVRESYRWLRTYPESDRLRR